MSFSPAQMYPGAFEPDADFLDGKFKNSSAPGVYDGSPLDNILFNQEQAFWDAVMTAGGEEYNNAADIPETSQLFKALQQSRQVEPLNNDWNGFFDPEHQEQLSSPAGYPTDSGSGGTIYTADDEWSLGNFSSGAANTISSDSDGVIFSVGTYKKSTFTAEQLALIDLTKLPIQIVDETGKYHFVNAATTGVNVTALSATEIKIELTNAIFAELSIAKVWEFFPTSGVGKVAKLGPSSLAVVMRDVLIEAREWRDVTAFRVSGVQYTNDRPYSIEVSAGWNNNTGGRNAFHIIVNGESAPATISAAGNSGISLTSNLVTTVPSGSIYSIEVLSAVNSGALSHVKELS